MSHDHTKYTTRMDEYRMDEGYSEDTGVDNKTMQITPTFAADLEQTLHGLTKAECGDVAYEILAKLPASSIFQVFKRLWHVFHKDPVQSLPLEIMGLVLSFLTPQELLTAAMVSRSWYNQIMESGIWRDKIVEEGWGLRTSVVQQFESALNRQHGPSSSSQTLHSESDFKVDRDLPNYKENLDSVRTFATEDTAMIDTMTGIGERGDPGRLHNSFRTSLGQRLVWQTVKGVQRINYSYLYKQRRRLERNWNLGHYHNFQFPHRDYPEEAHTQCVYTLQFEGNHLVSGSRDKSVRIWDLTKGRLQRQPLLGHEGSVLCLQFDPNPVEDLIISGSSDNSVILWRFSDGTLIRRLSDAHKDSVLNLRFDHRYLVTCSKDHTIKVWNRDRMQPGHNDYPVRSPNDQANWPDYILDMDSIQAAQATAGLISPPQLELDPYTLLMTLKQHGAAVNAIQIYRDCLVSASGDRSLRMWDIRSGECRSTMQAHNQGIACVQYDGMRIISGSSDKTIRIWDSRVSEEVARLEGHSGLVRTLQAAFADDPGSRDRLDKDCSKPWNEAIKSGEILERPLTASPTRPSSRKPRNLRSKRTKAPTTGGGSRWAKIVSGSYDESVIIWTKTLEEEWLEGQKLSLTAALTAAGPALPIVDDIDVDKIVRDEDRRPRRFAERNHQGLSSATASLRQDAIQPQSSNATNWQPNSMISRLANDSNAPLSSVSHDQVSQQWRVTTQHHPFRPNVADHSSSSINNSNVQSHRQQTSHFLSSQSINSRPRYDQGANNTQNPDSLGIELDGDRPVIGGPVAVTNNRHASELSTNNAISIPLPRPRHFTLPIPTPPPPIASQVSNKLFKLQFDARRIVCCSQDKKIVGWDFANEDEELIQACRFYDIPR